MWLVYTVKGIIVLSLIGVIWFTCYLAKLTTEEKERIGIKL